MIRLVTPLEQGSRLFEYETAEVLGQGGFGTTYLCHDESLDRRVVLKEFTPHNLVVRAANGSLQPLHPSLKAHFANGRATFLEEARTLAKFRHPNLVNVLRYLEANNTAYFVMDHESGVPLSALINGLRDVFVESEFQAIIVPLCRGLGKLHQAGIIHRDIKPANILIRPDGSPVLIDFGAAADFRNAPKGGFRMIMTPAYAPVEQFDPHATQGPWTDIYALGATMYEMLSGEPPLPSISRAEGAEMRDAATIGRGRYGDRLLHLIDRCLLVASDKRPSDAEHIVSLLLANDDDIFAKLIPNILGKMLTHFTNWASPNDGLYVDEFVSFAVCLLIADLSWRVGKGVPDKATAARFFGLIHQDIVSDCESELLRRGFCTVRRRLTLQKIVSRFDEYAATYLLDRQQTEWNYELTCKQAARNCLTDSHLDDVSGFVDLLRDVVDRARGRIKREFGKKFGVFVYKLTEDGWIREIVLTNEKH